MCVLVYFFALKPLFCEAKWFFWKSARFCARFVGGNANWTEVVHIVFCTTSTEQKILKQLWSHYFVSATIRLLLLSNKGQTTARNLKIKKRLIVHFGVWCPRKCVSQLVMFEQNTIFLQVWEIFSYLLTLSFLFWLFLLLVCLIFHFLYFLLLLFHKLSFYVLVIVSVVLSFLSFVLCYLLSFWFFFVFGFGSLEGLRVRWDGPKGHLTWP